MRISCRYSGAPADPLAPAVANCAPPARTIAPRYRPPERLATSLYDLVVSSSAVTTISMTFSPDDSPDSVTLRNVPSFSPVLTSFMQILFPVESLAPVEE